MAQTLDQIIKSLDASYNPSRKLINQQIAALPGQENADISGLNATKDQAFNDITNGARDRGMGFSGIPLSEQATYTASNFLPAVAKTKQAYTNQKTSLLDSLNNLGIDQRKTALGTQQQQQQLDFQREQLAAQQRAQAKQDALMSSLYGGGGGSAAAPVTPAAMMIKRPNGGFNFSDSTGKAISAASYASMNKVPIGTLLHQMASQGDTYAKQAYNQIRANQAWYNKHPEALQQEFSPLFWGT